MPPKHLPHFDLITFTSWAFSVSWVWLTTGQWIFCSPAIRVARLTSRRLSQSCVCEQRCPQYRCLTKIEAHAAEVFVLFLFSCISSKDHSAWNIVGFQHTALEQSEERMNEPISTEQPRTYCVGTKEYYREIQSLSLCYQAGLGKLLFHIQERKSKCYFKR